MNVFEDAADRIKDWLERNPAGGTKADIVVGTGINPLYFPGALQIIRRHNPPGPIPFPGEGWVYRISDDINEITGYQDRTMRRAHTEVSTLWTGTLEPFLRTHRPREVRRVGRDVQRLLEDLEDRLI